MVEWCFIALKIYSGETVVENLDREQLAKCFTEMAQNLEDKNLRRLNGLPTQPLIHHVTYFSHFHGIGLFRLSLHICNLAFAKDA